jgi:hypothetical protein
MIEREPARLETETALRQRSAEGALAPFDCPKGPITFRHSCRAAKDGAPPCPRDRQESTGLAVRPTNRHVQQFEVSGGVYPSQPGGPGHQLLAHHPFRTWTRACRLRRLAFTNRQIASALFRRGAHRRPVGTTQRLPQQQSPAEMLPPSAAVGERVKPSALTKLRIGIYEQRVQVNLALTGQIQESARPGQGSRRLTQIALRSEVAKLNVPVGAPFRDGTEGANFDFQDGCATVRRRLSRA